jgi:hypothetical protein
MALRTFLVGMSFMHAAALRVGFCRGPRAAVRYMKEMYYCSKRNAGLYLPVVAIDELIPQNTRFTVYRPAELAEYYASLTLTEISCLCCLVAARKPCKILELGTYRGLTTLNLAMNAPNAVVHTVDETNQWGSYHYSGCPEAERIRQHFGHTETFDFSKIGVGVDFCLIDAGHSYRSVRNDTAKVLPVMSDDGLILWHDYGRDDFLEYGRDGITRFLHEIAPAGVTVLQGSTLGILCVTRENRSLLERQLASRI